MFPQQAEKGGDFQYTKPFRNETDENLTYDTAREVIEGTDEGHINTLDFQPGIKKNYCHENYIVVEYYVIFLGTLSIFQGRRSLHSVTKCHGDKKRLLGVLHFSQR